MTTKAEDAFDTSELDEIENEATEAPKKKSTPRKTKAQTDAAKKDDEAFEASRRWRCKVESTRGGVQHFEMIVSDPRNPRRPIPIRGRCGVIIEAGLTKFMIDRLKESYRNEVQEVKADPNKDIGLLHRKVKLQNFTVEVYDEVENPKPVGSVK